MHELYKLKDELVKELGNQSLSRSSLDVIDKLAHAAKNVSKVIECCESDEYSNADGYSRRDDASYSRRRDSMGRYSRTGDDMREELRQLMNRSPDERTRKEIRNILERM